MQMRWRELLFAHWVVDPSMLRPLIPAGIQLDLFEERCYVGAVPFLMERVTPRLVPPLPGLQAFPELNLRTYVTLGGKPGVWFFSLDAGQKLAVRVARRLFHLPYFDARFEIAVAGSRVDYSALRTHRAAAPAEFNATYEAVGPVYRSAAGSLDAWLTERYCLYSADALGRIYRGEIDHQPWPLQRAQATVHTNTLGDWLGIELKHPPAALHFAKLLDVHAWNVTRIPPTN
jgi:uncharacterized protein YqjF (DUF2071 family)